MWSTSSTVWMWNMLMCALLFLVYLLTTSRRLFDVSTCPRQSGCFSDMLPGTKWPSHPVKQVWSMTRHHSSVLKALVRHWMLISKLGSWNWSMISAAHDLVIPAPRHQTSRFLYFLQLKADIGGRMAGSNWAASRNIVLLGIRKPCQVTVSTVEWYFFKTLHLFMNLVF